MGISAQFKINGVTAGPGAAIQVAGSSTVTITLVDTSGVSSVSVTCIGTSTGDPTAIVYTKSGTPLGSTITFTQPPLASLITRVKVVGSDGQSATWEALSYEPLGSGFIPICLGELTHVNDKTGVTQRLNEALSSFVGGSGYTTIQKEGVSQTQRTTLNFAITDGVAADSGGKTNITLGRVNNSSGGTVPALGAFTSAKVLTSRDGYSQWEIPSVSSVDFTAVKAALATANSSVGFNSQKLTSVLTPTLSTDAATKGYVDGYFATYGTLGGLTNSAPADVTKASAAVGVSVTAARSDHKHDISTATPAVIGTTNLEGSATSLARSDHIHALQFSTVNSLLASANADININSHKLTGVLTPTLSTDAATKGYIDGYMSTQIAGETWAAVLSRGATSGAVNPTIATSQYLNFATDVSIRANGGQVLATASSGSITSLITGNSGSIWMSDATNRFIEFQGDTNTGNIILPNLKTELHIKTVTATSTAGRPIIIEGGNALGPGNFNGGYISLKTGAKIGSGNDGYVDIENSSGTSLFKVSDSAISATLPASTTSTIDVGSTLTIRGAGLATTVAAAGDIRTRNGFSINSVPNGGGSDLQILACDTSNNTTVGNATGAMSLRGGSLVQVSVSGTPVADFNSGGFVSRTASIGFDASVSGAQVLQSRKTSSGGKGAPIALVGQGAQVSGAGDGGDGYIMGGQRDGSSAKRGGAIIGQLGASSVYEPGFGYYEHIAGSRMYVFGPNHSTPSGATDPGAPDGIVKIKTIADSAVTGSPQAGFEYVWASSTDGYWTSKDSSGVVRKGYGGGGGGSIDFATLAALINNASYTIQPIVRCVIDATNLVYNNGAGTLTASGNGVFPQVNCDNVPGGLFANDCLLVAYKSSDVGAGGVYRVTTVGTAGATLVLARDPYFDTAAKLSGATVRVTDGYRHTNTTWTGSKIVTLGTSVSYFRRDEPDPRTWIDRVEEWADSDSAAADATINATNNTTVSFGSKGFGYFTNTNGSITRDSNGGAESALHRLGVAVLKRGTSSAGIAQISGGVVVLDQHIEWNFYQDINLPTASDGTNTYSVYGGVLASGNTDGIYWNVASGNLTFHGIAASVTVDITGPTATAGQWFKIWICKPFGQNVAHCFVDDVLIGTFTAGQFGTSAKCRLGTQIAGSAGSSDRQFKINKFGDTIYDPLA